MQPAHSTFEFLFQRPLSARQRDYAAIDAYILVLILDCFRAECPGAHRGHSPAYSPMCCDAWR